MEEAARSNLALVCHVSSLASLDPLLPSADLELDTHSHMCCMRQDQNATIFEYDAVYNMSVLRNLSVETFIDS